MNTFALEIWYDEGRTCTFYTVKDISDDEEDKPSETDRFFDKYTIEGHKFEEQALMLFKLITKSIGDKYGAIDDFFNRPENKAYALPPKPTKQIEEIIKLGKRFPLRLFCYRITEQIVIIFNGGIKESETIQGSPTLKMNFHAAQNFVKALEEDLRSGAIKIANNNRYLECPDGADEMIIHVK